MNTPALLDPATVAAELIGSTGASAPAPAVSNQAPQPPAASQAESVTVTPTPDGKIDKAGRVFDASRYKSNPDGTPFRNRLGYFMPIGGRSARSARPDQSGVTVIRAGFVGAPAPAPVSAPAVSAPPAALPTPAAPAWSEAERAAAAAPASDAVAPGSGAVAAETAPAVDYSADAGKAISAGVFLLAGVVFDAREETTPTKPEAAHLTDATAAWIRSTGWRGGPLAGALLAWLAYFLGLAEKPKIGARLRGWFGSDPKPQKQVTEIRATPVAEPKPASNPAASAPAEPQPVAAAGLSDRY